MPRTKGHSIDKAIGARVKIYRRRNNLSQTALGKHLGISFQQIQKYENGTNRVAAATMLKIARVLNISAGELMTLDEQRLTSPSRKHIGRFTNSSEGKSLMRGFLAISSPLLRRHILGLVEALGR